MYGQDLSVVGMSFNSDNSLMALTTTEYFASFNCVPVRRIVKENAQGGMRCIAQLHRSPILVIVPSGDKPGTSPRRLSLWNCRTKSVIQEYGFDGTVLGCAINKDFLVVGTDGMLSVFELKTMTLSVKLPSRAGSVFALSDEEESALLAFPTLSTADASRSEGIVSVYSCRQGRLVSQVNAHKTAVSVLSFNMQGTLLASASVTGSIVRVFRAPEGECVFVFRHSVPTPLTLFSFPASSADQHAAEKRVSGLSFCPKGHFLLSVTSPSGAKGGYVNVFRVGGLASALPRSGADRADGMNKIGGGGGGGGGAIGSDASDEEEYCTVQPEDMPPLTPLSPLPATAASGCWTPGVGSGSVGGEDEESPVADGSGSSSGAASAWLVWQQQLRAQAAGQLRSLQALSQDYLSTGTAAAKAAAIAMGASAMAAAGTMPLLYARIHTPDAAQHMFGTEEPRDRRDSGSRDRASGVLDGVDDSSGGASHAKSVVFSARGREGPSFFAALNYVPTAGTSAEEARSGPNPKSESIILTGADSAANLALNVVTAVGGVYRRYNLSFLHSRSGEEGTTVSLSDQKPPSSAGSLPQTLSELLEDECALLE